MTYRDGQPVTAAYRSYVLALLDQDAAYGERGPAGPPLLVADYRRALISVLALDPSPPLLVEVAMAQAEAVAFTAGQRAGLDAAVIAIGEAWRPALLRGEVPARLRRGSQVASSQAIR